MSQAFVLHKDFDEDTQNETHYYPNFITLIL